MRFFNIKRDPNKRKVANRATKESSRVVDIRVPYLEESFLVNGLKNKHASAFIYLYEHHAAALWDVILGIVYDLQLSNNILHESFIKIWQNIKLYDPRKASLFTWMHCIAHNCAIKTLKDKSYKKIAVPLVQKLQDEALDIHPTRFCKMMYASPSQFTEIITLDYFRGHTETKISKGLKSSKGIIYMKKPVSLSVLSKS